MNTFTVWIIIIFNIKNAIGASISCEKGYYYGITTSSTTPLLSTSSTINQTDYELGVYVDNSTCTVCESGFYCPSSMSKYPCPEHTDSHLGSDTILQCFCVQGYACIYTKAINTTVAFNRTDTNFSEISTALFNAIYIITKTQNISIT